MKMRLITGTRGALRELGLMSAEVIREVGCAMITTATVAYMVCLFMGVSFPTGVSLAGPPLPEGCPNSVFRTGPSLNLPDCRAYEMVSPVEKNGGYINTGGITSSPDGEAIGFTSNSGFAGATSDLGTNTGYQSTRGASGWMTTAQTQSEAQFIDFHEAGDEDYLDYSFGNDEVSLDGGSRLYLMQEISKPAADLDFYLVGTDDVPIEVGPAIPPTGGGLPSAGAVELSRAEELYTRGAGFSADASHVVFKDPEPEGVNQWSFGGSGALLEYAGTGNTTPLLVGVDNHGQFVNECPTQFLGGTEFSFNRISNPISSNGNRVFFTDGCHGEVFARVNNGQPQSPLNAAGTCTNRADACTVQISHPSIGKGNECSQCAENPEPGFSRFFGASEDGSKVYFNTSEPLLGGSSGLYEYDFDAAEGDKITKVAPGFYGPTAVLGISQDGTHVYFFSPEVLTSQPSPDVSGRDEHGNLTGSAAVAQEGKDNLYVFSNGHIAFVATLQENDEPEHVQANVTPDGRFLVLDVHTDLTADDTSTASQVFEYDAQTQSMVRVSIGENGYNNDGNTLLAYPGSPYYEGDAGHDSGFADSNDAGIVHRGGLEEELQFLPSSYFGQLSVSADGAYVFFLSPDGLVSGALNRVFLDRSESTGEQPEYAQNVYEWHAGHVYLISDGKDVSTHVRNSQVHLLSTDLSGHDVFFETTDSLVPQDTDSNKDIYDARIGGGFSAPLQPASCSSDGCQGPLGGAPVLLSPGSAFQAGGDSAASAPVTPAVKPKPKPKKIAKCAKGKRLSHGRCVKAKPKKTPKKAKKASNDRRTNR